MVIINANINTCDHGHIIENGYIVYEYKNGTSEWMNGAFEVLKVSHE